MGLLKDIYDILPPEVKKQFGESLIDFLKEPKKLTVQEKNSYRKDLISKITEAGFSENFEEPLDYFGTLLALIAETTYFKNEGVIIELFYNNDYLFYFPAPSTEPLLRKGQTSPGKEEGRFIELKDKEKYFFWAVKKDESLKAQLNWQDIIHNIVLEGKNETMEFKSILERENITYERVQGIVQSNKQKMWHFFTGILDEENKIRLSFLKQKETKESISKALINLLNSTTF